MNSSLIRALIVKKNLEWSSYAVVFHFSLFVSFFSTLDFEQGVYLSFQQSCLGLGFQLFRQRKLMTKRGSL